MGEGAGGTRIRWETVASPWGMAMLATVNKWEKLGARYGGGLLIFSRANFPLPSRASRM